MKNKDEPNIKTKKLNICARSTKGLNWKHTLMLIIAESCLNKFNKMEY